MIKRRTLLKSWGWLTYLLLLSACSDRPSQLKVLLLKGSIPNQLLGDFRNASQGRHQLIFHAKAQLSEIYTSLRNWQQTVSPTQPKRGLLRLPEQLKWPGKPLPQADLITLGDSWLSSAIQQRWIQPMALEALPNWNKLPPPWQKWVRRNREGLVDPSGYIWGAPYRWGTVAIAYRPDKFRSLGWTPTDWSDLWREPLRDRFSLLADPRLLIAICLKQLGYDWNTPNIQTIPKLQATLAALLAQAKFATNTDYLQPLILEDTWLAVGWSADILPIQQRYPTIAAMVPQSGTLLWADLWVQPAQGDQPSSQNKLSGLQPASGDRLAPWQEWVDFCWQDTSALTISSYTTGTSPLLGQVPKEQQPKILRNNPLMNLDSSILEQSAPLLPLNPNSEKQYDDLWQQVQGAIAA